MLFQDFLRTIPLVQRHLNRTLRLNHQNEKMRLFLERNGIDPEKVLNSTSINDFLESKFSSESQNANKCEKNLETANLKIDALETKVLLLQIDYDNMLKAIEPNSD